MFIFSVDEQKLVRTIDIGAAPMGLLYPEHGDYFFVSSIKDKAITVLRKARDPQDVEIVGKVNYGRFRHMALSRDGRTLFAPVYEQREIAVIDVEALKVVKAFKLDEGCSLIATSPVGNDIYAVGYDSGKVYVLDAGTGELLRTITTHGEFRDIKVILEADKPPLKTASAG